MITHNQKTILTGDTAIGVTMLQEGVSRIFSVEKKQKSVSII